MIRQDERFEETFFFKCHQLKEMTVKQRCLDIVETKLNPNFDLFKPVKLKFNFIEPKY